MKRTINISEEPEKLNTWVQKSIALFYSGGYLDKIGNIYNYSAGEPTRIEDDLRRQIRMAHNNKNDNQLLALLSRIGKFPYDEPFRYLLENVDGFLGSNPDQVKRISDTLYSMTDEEVIVRLESPPKLNQQTGPMFTNWLRTEFEVENLANFLESKEGIILLGESEEVGKNYLIDNLGQDVDKRPDLIMKVNERVVIGEAKWIGSSGGNQFKSVAEVINFCNKQRGDVQRIGIIDGYPWTLWTGDSKFSEDKICVSIQESTYNIMSALLLSDYLATLLDS